jgi:hypothetical protein
VVVDAGEQRAAASASVGIVGQVALGQAHRATIGTLTAVTTQAPSVTITSVEPPPTSATTNGLPVSAGRLRLAARNASSASRSPAIVAIGAPRIATAGVTNAAALPASRSAWVAITSTWVAPWRAISAAYSRQIASERSMASGCSRPLASSPWPSRPKRQPS